MHNANLKLRTSQTGIDLIKGNEGLRLGCSIEPFTAGKCSRRVYATELVRLGLLAANHRNLPVIASPDMT